MTPPDEFKPHCSIAADSATEASLVRLLLDDFADTATHVQTPELQEPPRPGRPSVLLLAFKDLAKSEHYYLSMYRNGNVDAEHPHRTVLLCTQEDSSAAYQLCRGGLFDDYVIFWPSTSDPRRLLMAVHTKVGELRRELAEQRRIEESAAQASRVAELEGLLSAQLRRGREHIATTGRVVEQAEREIAAALQAWPATEKVVTPHWRVINESLQPLSAWAEGVMQAVTPQLQAARELGGLAKKTAQKLRVMVVDDNEFQRRIVGSILDEEGYEPIYAASGTDALVTLRDVLPDLILLDFQMPDIDGLEVMRQLSADSRLAPVPVIMVSGNGDKSVVLGTRKLGAVDFIVKPFNRYTLVTKVARMISKAPAADSR